MKELSALLIAIHADLECRGLPVKEVTGFTAVGFNPITRIVVEVSFIDKDGNKKLFRPKI